MSNAWAVGAKVTARIRSADRIEPEILLDIAMVMKYYWNGFTEDVTLESYVMWLQLYQTVVNLL